MVDESWNWIRLVNAVLGLISAIWLLRAFAPVWSKLNSREKSNSFILLLFTLTIASRSITLWNDPGRITLFTFSETVVLLLLLRHCYMVTTRRWDPAENSDFRDR